ncbi:MAG: Uma2 family endonuclease [Bryobacteraceae bacterium]|jgi:Uma2 family endonuclease
MAAATGLTIEDFERLPDDLARNHELDDGKLVDVSGNKPQHNELRDSLVELLRPFVREHQLGYVISEQEYDFEGNAHGPDVSFYNRSKRRLVDKALRVQRFVPDLAIEIVSANDTFESLAKKARRYRQCGTQEVWIFSVETRDAHLYSKHRRVILDENDDFRPEPIPGFSIRIGDLLDRH